MISRELVLILSTSWRACRAALKECPAVDDVHVIGRSKNTKVLLDEDFVIEKQVINGREITQKQPEGTFSQPNGTMCVHMVTWADRVVRGSEGDCLELYCGNGNFTVPMAHNFRRVVATEVRACGTAGCGRLLLQRCTGV